MDAKLIDRFWDAQFREPDYKDIKKFMESIYHVFVPKSKRMRVYQAHERIKRRTNTKKDLLTVLLFFLEAKAVYRTMQEVYGKAGKKSA